MAKPPELLGLVTELEERDQKLREELERATGMSIAELPALADGWA